MIVGDDPVYGKLMAMQVAGNDAAPYTEGWDHNLARLDKTGALMGGVLIKGDEYHGSSVVVHVAKFMPNWIGRDLLYAVSDYTFNIIGVEQVLAIVYSLRHETIIFNQKVGFREITRIPGAGRGGDLVIMSMRRDDCRWLRLPPKVTATREGPSNERWWWRR